MADTTHESEATLHYLVAGTANYPESGGVLADLPKVVDELAIVTGTFADAGGVPLPGGGLNPDSRTLMTAVADAVAEPADGPLVVYLSGHGVTDGAPYYYLCTHNTVPRRGLWGQTAISFIDLTALLRDIEGRQAVVVIDACFSEIALETAGLVDAIAAQTDGRRPEVYLIAAASRAEEARQLAFAQAFSDALRNPRVGRSQRYLRIDTLVDHINASLKDLQFARPKMLGSPSGEWRVFTNPHFRGPARPVPQQALATFTGRSRALGALRSCHERAAGSPVALCVTGASGSGKSILLTHFHDTVRDSPRVRGVLVDAHRRDLRDVIDEIQDHLGIERQHPARAVDALRQYDTPVTLFIDGVDVLDDDQADRFAKEFLLPIVEAPSPVRLVLSAIRPPESLHGITTVDLDGDAYFDRNNLVEFTATMLRSDDQQHRFVSDTELRAVALRIALRCGSSFRMARDLVRFGAYWEDDDVPNALTILRAVFSGRGLDVEWGVGLLAPLAFAEGPGIPDFTLWLDVARRSTGTDYSDQDLDRLLAALDDDVVTEVYAQPEQACWRLEDGSVADELAAAGNGRTMHEAFADALLAALPLATRTPQEWERATEYTRRHLAIHARKAGRLADLLDDPGFLLTTDVSRARRALFVEGSVKSTAVRRILDRLADPAGGTSAERAAQLCYLARASGLDTLADRTEQLPCAWRTIWAGHDGPTARVFAPFGDEGQELLAIGCADGSIRLRRLVGGPTTVFGDPLPGMVTGLAVGTVDGRPHALVGAFDGTVRLFDLVTGAATPVAQAGQSVIGCAIADGQLVVASDRGWSSYPHGAPEPRWDVDTGEEQFTAFTCGVVRGEPVVVLGGAAVLMAWSLRTGQEYQLGTAERGRPRRRRPTALAIDARTGAVVIGALDGTVRVLSANGTDRLIQRHGTEVSAVAVIQDGGPVVMSSGHDGTVHRTPLAPTVPTASIVVGDRITAMAVGPTGWIALATPDLGGAIVRWARPNGA